MADYCTSTDIVAELPEGAFSTTDIYADARAKWITTASRLIDGELGMDDDFFYPSTDAQTRYFDGSGGEEQKIGYWVSVASVAVSEEGEVVSTGYTALASADYLTWPYNKTPIRKLIMDTLNGAGDVLTFYAFRKGVKVTGVPGWSATPPADVRAACIIQCVIWQMAAKQAYQVQGANGEVGSIKIDLSKLDPRAEALIHHYKLELAP